MPVNKRNGRKQAVHLMGARAIQEINDRVNGTDWRAGNGRKPKCDLVRSYAFEHSDASQREIAAALGVSKTTVNKWLKPGWREEWDEQRRCDAAKISLRRDDEGRWVVAKLEGHPEAEGRVLDLSDRQACRISEGPKDWLVGKPQEPIS